MLTIYKNNEGFSYIGKNRAWHVSFSPFYIRTYLR